MLTLSPDTHAAQGIVWTSEEVSEQHGEHATDRVVVCSDAQIPNVSDLGKFRAAFGDAPVLSAINGTSIRVTAQRINRKHAKRSATERREMILNAIKGLRNAATATTVVVYRFPRMDGEGLVEYSGNSEAELVAALVDAEWPAEMAMKAARSILTK